MAGSQSPRKSFRWISCSYNLFSLFGEDTVLEAVFCEPVLVWTNYCLLSWSFKSIMLCLEEAMPHEQAVVQWYAFCLRVLMWKIKSFITLWKSLNHSCERHTIENSSSSLYIRFPDLYLGFSIPLMLHSTLEVGE